MDHDSNSSGHTKIEDLTLNNLRAVNFSIYTRLTDVLVMLWHIFLKHIVLRGRQTKE